MPLYYWYHCDRCDYRAESYRNVRRCECGGNLVREEPRTSPNRIVVEVVNGFVKKVLAERPSEVLVNIHDPVAADICKSYGGDYEGRVFGDGGLPIEPLPVERTAVGVVGPVEVRLEVAGAPEEVTDEQAGTDD